MPTQTNSPLPIGFQLESYRIVKHLSNGGFSIVYLAHDDKEQQVAIKEYLPAALALRADGQLVPSISPDNQATFRYGMRRFFEEGRSLASISHPNVVRVLNFFRANDTVYMVMHYEHGHTLQEYIRARPSGCKESFIRHVFSLLMNGLREVHKNKLLHLDLKPANIYIRNDGSPLLLDFGAVRQTLTDGKAQLKPMYTPGFASPEHYGDLSELGPWSDIYSIGASMYACITAQQPQPADQRVKDEQLKPAKRVGGGRYSNQLLESIDWCLRLNHLERPQSVFTLQKFLLDSVAYATRRPSLLAVLREKIGWE